MLLKMFIAFVAIKTKLPSKFLSHTFNNFSRKAELYLIVLLQRHFWSLNRPQETEYLLVSLTLEIKAPKKLLILRKQGRSNLKISLLQPILTTCLYYLQDNSF